MGLKGLMVFNSAVDRMNQSAQNLASIQEARLKRQREDEVFKLEKQKAELGIKEAQMKGELQEYELPILKAQMAEKFKLFQDINKGKAAEVNMAEQQVHKDLKGYKSVAEHAYRSDPDVKSYVAQNINPGLANQSMQFGAQDGMRRGMGQPVSNQVAVGPGGQTIMGQAEKETYPEAIPAEQTQMGQQQAPQQMETPIQPQQPQRPQGRLDQIQENVKTQYGERYWMNPKTMEVEQDPLYKESTPRQQTNDYFNQSDKLRNQFDDLSKDFRKIRDSYSRIEAAGADPSAAGDLALIFNYMKILDPSSVVRESEFATAQNSAGVPDRIRNIWNKALTGERLAPDQREDFMGRARKLYQSQAGIQQKHIEKYVGLADRFGIEPQDVVTDLYDIEAPGQEEDTNYSQVEGQAAPQSSKYSNLWE